MIYSLLDVFTKTVKLVKASAFPWFSTVTITFTGSPIEIPPFQKISIAKDGIITIQPLNAEPGEEINVGQIGTTRGTENVKLVKSLDGYIRTEEGGIPEPDQLSSIVSGFLESSNVKSVDQLVNNIEQSRAYEINVKFITTAKELDEAGASLMRIPN